MADALAHTAEHYCWDPAPQGEMDPADHSSLYLCLSRVLSMCLCCCVACDASVGYVVFVRRLLVPGSLSLVVLPRESVYRPESSHGWLIGGWFGWC